MCRRNSIFLFFISYINLLTTLHFFENSIFLQLFCWLKLLINGEWKHLFRCGFHQMKENLKVIDKFFEDFSFLAGWCFRCIDDYPQILIKLLKSSGFVVYLVGRSRVFVPILPIGPLEYCSYFCRIGLAESSPTIAIL